MRAGHASSPLHRHIDLCTVLVHIDGDTLHQHTHDLLAVLRRRFRGVPQCWDVVRQAQDRLSFTGRQRRGTLASEPRILLLQVLFVTECLFPAPLQLTGDQAVFGLDGVVLSGRPLRMVARPLKPLVPMGLYARAFSAQRRTMTIADVAEAAGINKSSAQRMVFTLEQLGYLRKHPQTRRYQLTPRVMEIGFNYLAANPLIAEFALKIGHVQLTWLGWLSGSIVPGLVSLALVPAILLRMAPPEISDTSPARGMAAARLP